MFTTNHTKNLKKLSGEQLLLMAVFGSQTLKPKIDRELDRRALTDTLGTQATMPVMHPAFTIGVA